MVNWKKLKEYLKSFPGEGYREIIFIAIIIGVVSGIGSIVFIELLKIVEKFFFTYIIGFNMPSAEKFIYISFETKNPFLIPIVVGVGGVISGFLVYVFAPEAEGHGTDAAIAAFHRFSGKVRRRVPIIKLIASVFTIGSGGSAGREGPMAQIGAGIGSYVADLLKVRTYYRRLAVAIGIGAGIGTIFKAPLGGAIFGIEVLYKRDFEVEALLPAFIASVIGYAILGAYLGYKPIFDIPSVAFRHPIELLFYSLLGILTAIFGILYVKVFYKVRDIFRGLKFPNKYKPLIGGLIVGLIGIISPEILGTGYGWMPFYTRGIFPIYNFLSNKWVIINNWNILVLILYIVAFLKILGTAFTIGSGGSGGVFAPGLGVGALVGAASSIIFIHIFPNYIYSPSSFLTSSVIIGMMSLFAAVSKAPVAVLIMVSEMTGSYELIAPSMLSIAISYLLSGEYTIYPEQTIDRPHSSAHIRDYHRMILEEIQVKNAIKTNYPILTPNMTVKDAVRLMLKREARHLPVVENNILLGMISFDKLKNISKDRRDNIKVSYLTGRRMILSYPNETLFEALRKMTKYNIDILPIVESRESMKYMGVITKQDVTKAHDQMIRFLIGEEELSKE